MPQLSDEECHAIQSRVEAAGKNANTDGRSPDHYRKEGETQQHWDRMWDLYREAWFVGNITKYVERYRGKEGIKDLRKARHYLDKLIELEEAEHTSLASPKEPEPDSPYRYLHYRAVEGIPHPLCGAGGQSVVTSNGPKDVTCPVCKEKLVKLGAVVTSKEVEAEKRNVLSRLKDTNPQVETEHGS